MNNNISIIVFSKGRPMQIHAYLESILFYSDISEEDITVILCETKGIDYDKVINTFPKVKWIKEENFEHDLKKVLKESKKYIMFGCDDVVFVSHFSLVRAAEYLSENNEVFGFSIRLGKNILPSPKSFKECNDIIEWNWEAVKEIRFDYPWELDCTLYRKEDVVELTMNEKNPIKNPNFYEAMITLDNRGERIKRKHMASYLKGNAVVITVNRVQDSHPNGFDDCMTTDIVSLNRMYNEENNSLDIKKISEKYNHTIHVGADYFILRKNSKGFSKIRILRQKVKKIYEVFDRKRKRVYNFFERRYYKNNKFLKKINVHAPKDTLNILDAGNYSFVRFGNNEISIMQGFGVAAQSYDENLKKRLINIFYENDNNFKVAVPYHYFHYAKYTGYYENVVLSAQNQRKFILKNKAKDMEYLDSGISTLYEIYSEGKIKSLYDKWEKMLKNKKVTLILGEGTLDNIKCNALDVCESVEYINAPSMNAFEKYDEILDEAKKVEKDRLICVALGPTAKPLVYDLYKAGYTAWDLGHYLKDYDSYCRKCPRTDAEITRFYMPD